MSRSHKKVTCLVRFRPGTRPPILLSDNLSEMTFRGGRYVPVPSISISVPEDTGTLQEVFAEIDAPLVVPGQTTVSDFLEQISSGRAFPETSVTVYQIVHETEKVLTLFDGIASKAFRNKSGKRNRVSIQAMDALTRLKVPLGLPLNHTCAALAFGETGCFFNKGGIYHAGTNPGGLIIQSYVSFADRGFVVSINALDVSQENRIRFPGSYSWANGYIERDGLRLAIREHRVGTNTFVLFRQPPAEWNGAAFPVELHPGCRQTRENCEVYGNVQHFMGVGHAIPAYNPTLQEGG